MLEGLKDAISAKPAQGLCVSIGFWLLAAALILLPDKLHYMVTFGQPFLVLGAIGYLIPAFKGIPDWIKTKSVINERKEIIRNLDVAAKDLLWGMLTRKTRSINIFNCNNELRFYEILHVVHVAYTGVTYGNANYSIHENFWKLLQKEGKTLLYEGKHKPSNPWPTN